MVVALSAWLSDELGKPVTIPSAERTSYGYSRENWVFEATWSGETRRLIVRRDPVGSLLDTDRRTEIEVLTAMSTTDVPVPTVRVSDLEGGRLGRPSLVMDLCPGRCDPYVLNGLADLNERRRIALSIYDQLCAIHQLDWKQLHLPSLQDPVGRAAHVMLNDWEAQLEEVQCDPEPELAYAIAWLRDRTPVSKRTTLVHGDFKPGNVLLDDETITAVLDWETAHLGDPHEDLGWVTNPIRAGEHRIEKIWEPEHLLDHWSEITGWEIDPASLRWWQIFANLKLSIILLRGGHEFLEGRLDRNFLPPWPFVRVLLDQMEG
jgi:aminoglycoside phosphotransferase (APT) family kinase protein